MVKTGHRGGLPPNELTYAPLAQPYFRQRPANVFIGGESGDGVEWWISTGVLGRPILFRLTITAAAFAAIADTIPQSVSMEAQRAPDGGYFIWLDPRCRPAQGAARPRRELQRRHSQDGEGLTPTGARLREVRSALA